MYIYIAIFVGKYVWEDMSCSTIFFVCLKQFGPPTREPSESPESPGWKVLSVCAMSWKRRLSSWATNRDEKTYQMYHFWKTNMGTPNLNWMFGSDDFLIFNLGELLKSMSNYAGHCKESKNSKHHVSHEKILLLLMIRVV